MIGLIMAGGRGTRMQLQGEKLLLQYKKPIILHVVDALSESGCFSKIVAATSPHTALTKQLLLSRGVQTVDTAGMGYVQDLNSVLHKFDEPVFVTSADLPLMDAQTVRGIVSKYKDGSAWQSFVVTKKFLDHIGINLEFSVELDGILCYYTGISIVDPKKITKKPLKETLTIFDDKKIAVNVNTKKEYDLLKYS